MKLKNLIYIMILATGFVSLNSCSDYLDRDENDEITEAEVFARYEKVNQLVTDVYASAKKANRPLNYFNHFSSSAITDECEGTAVEGGITNKFNTGAWNQNEIPGEDGQYWSSLYEDIRKANNVLENVEKYNTPDNPLNEGDLACRIGEVYFMRAYFHWLLVRNYGEVPYLDRKINPGDPMDFKKESVHAVIEKIVADAQEAYKRVPARYAQTSNNFGRVDKGACLGLIAMSRWIAATPLWNGAKQFGYDGNRVFESEYTYDASRWEKAKVASKAVLDFSVGGMKRYSLYTEYTNTDFTDDQDLNLNNSTVYKRLYRMFYDMDAYEKEAVFFVTRAKDQGWFGDIFPPTRSGSSRQQPVQEQVDEYEYIAGDYGYPIYSKEARNAGYDDANPYKKGTRDPRFYRDILFHGAAYRTNKSDAATTNTFSGADAIGLVNATTTGYYLRKFQVESWNKDGDIHISAPPVWRLPEFIYIYAEAVNETQGPTQEIYDLINEVRERSFMVKMPEKAKTDYTTMRDYIKREWRVEFFYENKRPWMCRLYLEPNSQTEIIKESVWSSSGTTNTERSINYWKNNNGAYPKCQRMINGMRPVADNAGLIEVNGSKYRMERFCVEDRVFSTKHYLFPILERELKKTPTLVQNPGW